MTAESSKTILTVDCGGSALRGRTMRNGETLQTLSVVREDGTELDEAARLIETLVKSATGTPAALAIAVPGVVDYRSHAMVRAHEKYKSFEGINLVEWAHGHWGLPTVVENDARAALIGETTSGVAAGHRDAVALILGTGIGTAAMMEGEVLRGQSGHAGILGGHLTVDIRGDRCPCGNQGCAEAIASTWALAHRRLGPESEGLRGLFDAARANDPEAQVVLEEFLRVWGATVVSLCHSFDPTVVVVTGAPAQQADVVLPAITGYVEQHLWSSLGAPLVVSPSDPDMSVTKGLYHLASVMASTGQR